nr:hypothetical protein [Chengkuizengella sediminis]
MSKRSYSAEEKYEILKALEDHYSTNELESIYNVHHTTILEWKHKIVCLVSILYVRLLECMKYRIHLSSGNGLGSIIVIVN